MNRFILFHGARHPVPWASPEVEAFLTHLAVERKVSASTRTQAMSANSRHQALGLSCIFASVRLADHVDGLVALHPLEVASSVDRGPLEGPEAPLYSCATPGGR